MKPVPRSPWITLHRYLGLAAIPLLAFAAITGSLLCMVRPIDAALNADLFRQQPVASPLPAATVVDRFAARHPEWQVRSFPLTIAADERIPVKAARADAPGGPATDQLFLDRATGEPAGARRIGAAWSRRGATELLHDAHYTLLGGKWGRWIMGIVAIAWLIGHCIGFYLTLPLRAPFWKQWKRSWKLSFGSMFARFMLDLHKVNGLWLFVPLTAVALTSVGLNFFTEAYEPLAGALFREPPERAVTAPARPVPLTFSGAVAAARQRAAATGEQWLPAAITVQPATDRIGVQLCDDGRLNYHALGPVVYLFDRRSHAFAEAVDPYRGNPNLAMIRLLYPLHSGRIGGLATVVLVFLSGLATAALCVTGVYVWWKKRKSRVALRRARVPGLSRRTGA